MASKATRDTTIVWSQTRGRCGTDSPAELPDDIAADAINMVLFTTGIGQRRPGWPERTFGTTGLGVNYIGRWIAPDTAIGTGFFWVNREATPKMKTYFDGTATVTTLTLTDAMQAPFMDVSTAEINGKLYVAYNSAVNRLHVIESASGSSVRRTGLAAPGAPSVADTGSGTYAATIRYYRVQLRAKSGTLIIRQSNLGTAASFTPSGTGTHARVTQPTLPGEGETHWVVYGSPDGEAYYDLSGEIAVATTTYDDNENPTDYDDNTAAPDEGAYSNWPSVKFLLSIGDHLLGFGVWESTAGDAMTPKNGRVYFSPILDSSSTDDDERISNTDDFRGHIDIARGSGAYDRALCGPLDNSAFVGQSLGIFLLSLTGDAEVPFRRVVLSRMLGVVNQWSTFMGEDESGRPCVYFCDPSKGPYRYGANGFEWLGYDVLDYWAQWNGNATNRSAHGAWDPWNRRAYWWIAVGSGNDPSVMLVFHPLLARYDAEKQSMRAGWTVWTGGTVPECRCSATLYRPTLQGQRLIVYGGASTDFIVNDDTTAVRDGAIGVNNGGFVASLLSKAWQITPLHHNKRLMNAYLLAKTQAATTIYHDLVRNFGDESDRTSSASIAPAQSETRKLVKFEDAAIVDAYTLQVRLGDTSTVTPLPGIAPWRLDVYTATIEVTDQER